MSSEFIRILLIEHNVQDRALFSQLMETNRYRTYPMLLYSVKMVTTLNEGVDLIKAEEVDVVVVDLLLENTSPNDILELIGEASRRMPVVALTSDEDIDYAIEAIRHGAQDYLIKSRANGDLIERAVRYAIERKRIEEHLNQVNDNLQQFAYIVSHDLKQPLSGIVGFLVLLEKRYKGKVLDEKAEEFIGNSIESATRMNQLIDGLLQFSKIDSNGKAFEKTGMNEMLEIVKKNLDKAITESDATITNDPLPIIMADPIQMVQLLQNLIANAIKFRNKVEPPRIHVSATNDIDEWTFSVKDNGIGIPKEQQGRIFEMFQRLHSIDEYEGTGIGLAFAKKIVERHGGRIWVESEEGKGATFYFTLPA